MDDDDENGVLGRIEMDDLESKEKLSLEDLQEIIIHAFLPKKLPQKEQENLPLIEQRMLSIAIDGISKCIKSYPDLLSVLGPSLEAFRIWRDVQPGNAEVDELKFISSVKEFLTGQPERSALPIYIRGQNCTLLISKNYKAFELSTFRPSLPSEMVMSTVGSVKMEFPETKDEIYNNQLLESETFLTHIYELATQEFQLSMASRKRGEHFYAHSRDVPDPLLVSDWVVGALCPKVETEIDKIKKKIRDQVNCEPNSQSIPFRRSGLWMSIKVTLQLLLNKQLQEANAKIIYKLVMLRILTSILEMYLKNKIEIDLTSQMNAKLARRVYKITQMINLTNSSDISNFKDMTLTYCESIVSSAADRTNVLWMKTVNSNQKIPQINRSTKEFQNDLLHSILWLDNHIQMESQNSFQKTFRPVIDQRSLRGCSDFAKSFQIKTFHKLEDILTGPGYSSFEDLNKRMWLHDTETFIKCGGMDKIILGGDDNFRDEVKSLQDLKKVIQLYMKEASTAYLGEGHPDPVGFSQMVLVTLNLFHILDKAATKRHPLLLEYHSGINPNLYDRLILPHLNDMKLLEKLLVYFTMRNEKSKFPHIINEATPNSDSFGVRYASQNQGMITWRNSILAAIANSVQLKKAEVLRVKEECQNLEREMGTECYQRGLVDDIQHYHEIYIERHGKRYWKMDCSKCLVWVVLRVKRKSVSFYEKPFPEDHNNQWAITFELNISQELALFRDLLAVNCELMGVPILTGAGYARQNWHQYLKSKGHANNLAIDSGIDPIQLVSSRVPPGRTSSLDVIHNSEDQFILDSILDAFYSHKKGSTIPQINSPTKLCTFQINSTSKPDSDTYASLQWTINSTTHTQNSVISKRHHDCHKNLSSEEFTAFGSLRADGHCLQLWNLYRLIYDRALSLHKEPVLSLILQTIWQIGPKSAENSIRESHHDFIKNLNFSQQFIQMLSELRTSIELNYREPLALLTIIITTTRIMELTEYDEVVSKCKQLLKECRAVVDSWAVKIHERINTFSEQDDHKAVQYFKERLLEATLSSFYSFNSSTHQNELNTDDLVHWLQALSRFHQLTEEDKCHKDMSIFLKTIISTAQTVPLKLNVDKSPNLNAALASFVSLKWPVSINFELEEWREYEDKRHILIGCYANARGQSLRRHFVSFDLINGSFLVNGTTLSTLSSSILGDELFKRFFKESKFKIERDLDSQDVMRTLHKFHGYHYEFRTTRASLFGGTSTVIWELGTVYNDPPMELLSPKNFRGIIAERFLENYTHWLDHKRKCVYFRKIPKTDSDYELPHEYVLYRDEKKNHWLFYDERQKKYLFSINSSGYNQIASALKRLEKREEINILFDLNGFTITVKLPRFQLTFTLTEGRIQSEEYEGYEIAEEQNAGTLIGLKEGLLLHSFNKRILIIPHGKIENLKPKLTNLSWHHATRVNLDDLRHPKFFVYELDPVLRILKVDKSVQAWLYLAALHANTSSALPDPFTGLSGTEAAISILTSARIWPSTPYDQESINSLKSLRRLAPKRQYYGKQFGGKGKDELEITEWPQVIPSMAAFDGYPLIVDKLLENSKRLLKFYANGNHSPPKKKKNSDFSGKLQIRSYQRFLPLYNGAVVIPKEFIKEELTALNDTKLAGDQLILRKSEEIEASYSFRKKLKPELILHDLINMSQIRFLNIPRDNLVTSSLSRFVKGIDSITVYPKGSAGCLEGFPLSELLHMSFKPNWLLLYDWATSKSVGPTSTFTLVLEALAYKGAGPFDQLLHFHHISYWISKGVKFPKIPDFLKPLEEADDVVSAPSTPKLRRLLSSGERMEVDKLEEVTKVVPGEGMYNFNKVYSILESHITPEEDSDSDLDQEEKNELTQKYYKKAKGECRRISSDLERYWPCHRIDMNAEVKAIFGDATISSASAMEKINEQLSTWFVNYRFNKFVDQVQATLDRAFENLQPDVAMLKFEDGNGLEDHSEYLFSSFLEIITEISPIPDGIDTSLEISDLADLENNLEAREIFNTGRVPGLIDIKSEDDALFDIDALKNLFFIQRQICESKIKEYLDKLSREIQGESVSGESRPKRILHFGQISPRLVPTTLLKHIFNNKSEVSRNVSELIGALGVLWTNLQRINRCQSILAKAKERLPPEFIRELENPGHINWSPSAYPSWLLLELELNMMIRPIQVKVAQQMISMPGKNRNGVMQLNMGEGKTSMIVPMMCSVLSKKNSICRVTVLKSIFKMNLNILKFAIGGLINQRVYTFPSWRNQNVDFDFVENLQNLYEEAMNSKGVILTIPEHRLSFYLLALDKILKEEFELGLRLKDVQEWLNSNCRDVMDECDELLDFKYQLVYTTGSPVDPDGKKLRWKMCQKILTSVQNIMGELLVKFQIGKVEYNGKVAGENPERFVSTRLLCDGLDFLKEFRSLVADDLLESLKGMNTSRLKRATKAFLVEEETCSEDHAIVMAYLKDKPELLNKILIISAYLKRGVLELALKKRWRVEYGVNPVGDRSMAVPFRAKDCAAERTEFGHADLAIVLTHLSYYYSGLEETQLLQTFDILKARKDGEAIFDWWTSKIPKEKLKASLRQFGKLNFLAEMEEREKFIEVMRMHKEVINFWLSHKVFPKECKQFERKLATSAWDLVSERHCHPITGFSGTNSSKMLLPLPICQKDLDELENTNLQMDQNLLRPENDGNHKWFRMGVTCDEILKRLKDDSKKILIDSGALLLELDNEQVAQRWLEIDLDAEAAIYFNRNDEILVKAKKEVARSRRAKRHNVKDVPFEVSPYRSNLHKCVVFLDDQHTRGIDLKFPEKASAAVTIGARMGRDKLMQACMRMRQLGRGHSISFYLSHEAEQKVKGFGNGVHIRTRDVIEWTKQNTREFNENGLLYWVLGGRNYLQKLFAGDLFKANNGERKEVALDILARQCEDDEVTKLMDMYGHLGKREKLLELVPVWFGETWRKLDRIKRKRGGSGMPVELAREFERIRDGVVERCRELYPDREVFSSKNLDGMDQEQEKELEKEKEVEVEEEKQIEIERPPGEHQPNLHLNVKQIVLNGKDLAVMNGVVRISEVFKEVTFNKEIIDLGWGWGEAELFATEDFCKTIQTWNGRFSTDSYLRPVEYVVSFGKGLKILVLSSYEVNRLLPEIRKVKGDVRLRMFSRRRLKKNDILLNNPNLQLPSSDSEVIGMESKELAAFLITSGNLYFGSKKEEAAFEEFLNLSAKVEEVEEEEGEIIEDAMDVVNGVATDIKHSITSAVMKKILACRHPVISKVFEVVTVLDKYATY